MSISDKSTVEEIRARFDGEVERFSNLATGQTATVDSAHCMDLIARAGTASAPQEAAVLDVGCGAGNYSLKILEYRPKSRVTLVDLSGPMLERAKARLGPAVDAAIQGDVRELEFEAERFDVIVAAAVLHHLRSPSEWSGVFARFFRWLKPGGGLWIFDLVSHEDPRVQDLMWADYGRYLESMGGAAYRDRVFAYIEKEDTPTSLTHQTDLLRGVGFASVDVLHKHSCFAAFGGIKAR